MDERIAAWFAQRGWEPFGFQRQVWQAIAERRSGLLHASTGGGKTLAVWFGALARHPAAEGSPARLSVLWITPMRALAQDTARALVASATELGASVSIGVRTGDTSVSERARQERRLPTALVTTPESVSLLLSRADAQQQLGHIELVVVDEWHELLGNKRGVQTQLVIARLRQWNPQLMVWGLSATLGNLEHAQAALLGADQDGMLIQGTQAKALVIDTLIPERTERFPWAGHMGITLLGRVVAEIDASGSTLVFTNTRSQAEVWYQALLDARPDWAGLIALHHGSIDQELRQWVELGIKEGRLRAVVCTSSLDLGVDFLPVERVLQIGSPKGVARLLQRAGRSGHAPGRVSRATCVPTHSFELVEGAAARAAISARHIESRVSPEKPIDVLLQHLVTIALGGGFRADELWSEVRSCWAYRELSVAEWQWALHFVTSGGHALHAYPEYKKISTDDDGVYRVHDRGIAKRHRMSIGTIVGDAAMEVKFLRGGRIGSMEESFLSRLRAGDCFLFAGRALELVRVNEMTAYVRRAPPGRAAAPRWLGGRMPLSSELALSVRNLIAQAGAGQLAEPEMQSLQPLFELQSRWSAIPARDELLLESAKTREGHHLFVFPFAGRLVHSGLAALLAWRIARSQPATFSIAVNDYGLELLTHEPVEWEQELQGGLLSEQNLQSDIDQCVNATEMGRRRFREIARVSGLVFQGFPGSHKSTRQLQASSGLIYDVFARYDPHNLLLAQARAEALQQELELNRLEETLRQMQTQKLLFRRTQHVTPFAFPLMVERIREKLSTEKLSDRVARMIGQLERVAQRE
jgi:ATP-dependent Lhr-like helicase